LRQGRSWRTHLCGEGGVVVHLNDIIHH
jgi:hypothetical protein